MATELGQAYVQIMPSAKGIKGSIQGQLSGEATAAGDSAGSLLGGSLVAKLAGIIAAAKIGELITKGISASISEGANLQQSLGGIETLFKGSADKVKKYANEAYKTSGLSANDYMENVTSFSASLLQSLGGDTAKAADVANMAMVDMSDNSNKMGTSMENIQNAYSGFARGSYVMLDNLKLGYSGTKEEMQRLLTDATKLTGVKYDINNLSDVYEAIHAIQGQIGITGTTAKEAASTFSGSFASMKSSWSNVLGGLSLGQDIKPALNALAETTSTFLFRNLIPMVTNVIKGLPGAITTFFQAAAPQFLSAGTALMDSLGIGISGGASGILSKIQTVISPIIQGFQTAFSQIPALFQTIVSAVSPFIETIINGFSRLDFSGIQALISNILPALQAGITTMAGIVKPAFDGVVESIVGMWNAAQPLLTTLAGALMPAFQVLGSFLGGVLKGILMGVSSAFDAIKIIIQILTPVVDFLVGVFQKIAPVLQTVAQWIGTAIGLFANMGSAGSGLSGIMSSAWSNIKSAISTAGSSIGGVISSVRSFFSSLGSAGSALGSLLSGVWRGIVSVISGAVGSIAGFIGQIKAAFSGLGNINLSGAGSAIMEGFLSGLQAVWGKIKSFVGGIADWIKEHKGPIEYYRNLLVPAGTAIMTGLDESLQERFKGVKSTVSGIADKLTSEFSNGTTLAVDELSQKSTYSIDDLSNSSSSTDNSMNTIIQILLEILAKDPDIILDGDSVVEKIASKMSDKLNELSDKAAGKKGFRRGMA